MEGFTRQEAIALAKTTSSNLAYLDRAELVVPEKYGNSKKPTVIYKWEQILEIRVIQDLRKKTSPQTVKKVVQFLQTNGFNSSLADKHLVVINDEVFLVPPDWSNMPKVMRVASKRSRGLGQFVLVVFPPLEDLVREIWETAKKSEVIDFESFKRRAKAKPANVA
ncbi:MerR family transcriptional regulator [Myxacorys almedinensis]|uniref:MerR family transcriptional regulator n=1 Tax=Myxacorys almedinensis A TaxID=2690445 RepID=A0A8J7Z1Y9_9CYAN|nr:MerR family transcriptional regulator [Myxacorys almedinensis]NDJ18569.1 MerR family transcriptional regulator [Myxacorys almedinensis A]